jgi:Fur family ferric uptake transcriptional regulator
MTPAATQTWTAHTRDVLAEEGHRASGPRQEVIEAVASLGCSVTAREISELLRERGSGVGLASIYRALDLLERLGLIKRFDVGEGVARYEPAHPSGEHHHHVVCDTCGKVEPFEDGALERAIHRLSDKVNFEVAAHDVTLHGQCPACRADGRPQTADLRNI